MDEIFLPTLHSFENDNVFTGSLGTLRFKVTPVLSYGDNREVDRWRWGGVSLRWLHG